MAKATIVRETPVPAQPPIKEVTLVLSAEEAKYLRKYTGDGPGTGPNWNIFKALDGVQY